MNKEKALRQKVAIANVTRMILVLSGVYKSHPLDEANITDFLTDLMHYCKKGRLDFDSILSQARKHFEEEK